MAQAKKVQEAKAQAEEAAEITDIEQDLEPDTAEVDVSALKSVKEPTKVAKAGPKAKRAKAEAAEKDQPAKPAPAEKADKPKPKPQVSRDPLARRGKKYREAYAKIERERQYDLEEALQLIKQTSTVKFDASVELHVNLGVDPRQADQMVRASVVLPAGTGKSLRVAVLTGADKQADAKQAGADLVGETDLIAQIEKGQLDFDVLVTTPDMMPQLGKLAKILGPKGLMPNPKSGSVTTDVAKAVKAAKAGKVEFRIDKQAIVHQAIGKVSFSDADLLANARAQIAAIMHAKPAGAKGTYVKGIALTTSMGPSIRLNPTQAIAASRDK